MNNTPLLHEVSGIEYRVCLPDDTHEIGRLLAENFIKHDPPAIAVGLTPDEFEAFVTLWLPGAGADGLTIIARDRGTGQIAGALLTDDAAAPPPQGIEGLSEKLDPIFDLLGQIDTDYRDGRTILPGQYLHLFLLGVAEQFTRRALDGSLLQRACEMEPPRDTHPQLPRQPIPYHSTSSGNLGLRNRPNAHMENIGSAVRLCSLR
jgi:hypothetical protein